jgi:DNA-binding GntR family transcriptional regulator
MAELTPLIREHKSLVELTHEAIRERILSGYFKPGDWLRQEELSQQLAVSHTPVREALDLLVAYGAKFVMLEKMRVPYYC